MDFIKEGDVPPPIQSKKFLVLHLKRRLPMVLSMKRDVVEVLSEGQFIQNRRTNRWYRLLSQRDDGSWDAVFSRNP